MISSKTSIDTYNKLKACLQTELLEEEGVNGLARTFGRGKEEYKAKKRLPDENVNELRERLNTIQSDLDAGKITDNRALYELFKILTNYTDCTWLSAEEVYPAAFTTRDNSISAGANAIYSGSSMKQNHIISVTNRNGEKHTYQKETLLYDYSKVLTDSQRLFIFVQQNAQRVLSNSDFNKILAPVFDQTDESPVDDDIFAIVTKQLIDAVNSHKATTNEQSRLCERIKIAFEYNQFFCPIIYYIQDTIKSKSTLKIDEVELPLSLNLKQTRYPDLKREIKIPAAYYKIVAQEVDPLLQAKMLLNDYTKNNSASGRFFHGHWNRHHALEVNKIVNRINSGSIETLDVLLAELNAIKPNNFGSLAKRMVFIQFIIPTLSMSNNQEQRNDANRL